MFEAADRDKFISPRSKIMNVHQDRRVMTLDNPVAGSTTEFVLRQGTTVVPLKVQGEPLGFGQIREFLKDKIALPFSFDINKDFTLEQVFTSKNTPIKMINALELARTSHRMANLKLVNRSPNVLKKDTGGAEEPVEGGEGPGGPGMPPGGRGMPPGGGRGMPMMGEGGGMMGRGMGAAGAVKDLTLINGIDRAIYIHTTDQCRHLPFAMSLILDQTIMNEVLASLANSKLRIQLTQFHYQHYSGYKSSNFIAGAAGPTDASAENSGGPGNPGFRPPVAGPGGPGAFRPLLVRAVGVLKMVECGLRVPVAWALFARVALARVQQQMVPVTSILWNLIFTASLRFLKNQVHPRLRLLQMLQSNFLFRWWLSFK